MVERIDLLRGWLNNDLNLTNFSVTTASEDASFRRYYRISWDHETAIVMDAPPEHESCDPFIDITGRLLRCGVNVPTIKASNLQKGFLLLEDLGVELYLDVLTADNVDKLYVDAINAILKIQTSGQTEGLPVYDEKLLLQEMLLFRDWLVGRHLQIEITPSIQKIFDDTFLLLMNSAIEQPQVFVHRDYHSRNLLINRQNNPGVIDYQDAVIGPVTYDLVSLLKDCYISWPREKVIIWLQGFHNRFQNLSEKKISKEQFLRWFDLMGVQRHLKASGIFARLLHRDSKVGFMQDIPRTLSYILELEENYPELLPFIEFIGEEVMPGLEEKDS